MDVSFIWPPIDAELADLRDKGLLKGKILNAGAGLRDISHLIDGTLVNQDLEYDGDERKNIDIFSSIEKIPREEGTFDGVICIAVLEHVENPDRCVREFYRVVKKGGFVVASIPFLQPEHKVPTDYQRYTRDGICYLFESNGFVVDDVAPLHTVYHTLYWIVYEWLRLKNTFLYKVLRFVFLVPLGLLCRKSTLQSDILASGFRIVARKA
jgi:SAM-dependent methyltransferase